MYASIVSIPTTSYYNINNTSAVVIIQKCKKIGIAI